MLRSTVRSNKPYARAPTRDPHRESDAEARAAAVHTFLAVGSVLASTAKSLRWCHMMAIRTSCIARAIRLTERALGAKYVGREKQPRAWVLRALVEGVVVPVVRVEWDHLRRLKETPTPVRVVILQRHALDETLLLRALSTPPRAPTPRTL
jgi:hypothetical protein